MTSPDALEQEHQSVALIRALRDSHDGDQPELVARWTAIVQDSDIEDVEAAVADLELQLAKIGAKLLQLRERRFMRGEATHDELAKKRELMHWHYVRSAQAKFLRAWIAADDARAERDASRAARAEREAARAARDAAESRSAQATRLAIAQANREAHTQPQNVRDYKAALLARRAEIGRARMAAISDGTVPDGSDSVLIVQAARHLILSLCRRLAECGTPQPILDEHDQALMGAIQDWLTTQAIEQALADIPDDVQAAPLAALAATKPDVLAR